MSENQPQELSPRTSRLPEVCILIGIAGLAFAGCNQFGSADERSNEVVSSMTTEYVVPSQTPNLETPYTLYESPMTTSATSISEVTVPIVTSALESTPSSSVVATTESTIATTSEVAASPESPSYAPFLAARFIAPSIGLNAVVDNSLVSHYDENGQWIIEPDASTNEALSRVAWWSEQQYSQMPASADQSQGTMILMGHACKTADFCSGNNFKNLVVGDQITIEGNEGQSITIAITEDPLNLEKSVNGVANSDKAFNYGVPGRVELFSCAYDENGNSNANWLTVGQIVS